VCRITTRDELLQSVELWTMIRNITLSPRVKYEIKWRWTQNDKYSTVSAYKIQFQGSHTPFQVGNLWKSRVEPKVKVSAWTAMHKKILTASNLASRGMQHNSLCPLCNSSLEDIEHLLIACPFANEVTRLLWSWFQFQGAPTTGVHTEPASWLAANAVRANLADIRLASGILLYARWNVWKERNKRIFHSTQRSEFQVACAAKEDIVLYCAAIRDFQPP
jgi:hypothetical protein